MILEMALLVQAMSVALPPVPDYAAVFGPKFYPTRREVSNWRLQGARNLDWSLEKAASLAGGQDVAGVSRCVKLNNYWCVKRAGWAGEIASDAEGHVAFSSPREGAMAAAALLRRYYVVYKLRTARAIVSRWAPPGCGLASLSGAPSGGRAANGRVMGGRRTLGPEPKGLTTRGLANTARAKFLAARRGGVGVFRTKNARMRVRAILNIGGADHQESKLRPSANAPKGGGRAVRLAMTPTPSIMIGFAEPSRSKPLADAMDLKTLLSAPTGSFKLPPLVSCFGDGQRIQNYASHLAEGVAISSDADLKLFDEQGRPQPMLARALVNMAAVEIGPLKVRPSLVKEALAALFPSSFIAVSSSSSEDFWGIDAPANNANARPGQD